MACQNLEGLGRLPGGNDVHNWTEHADGIAGFLERMRGNPGFEKTSKAGGKSRANGHGQAIARNRGGVNPGPPRVDCEIIDEEAGLKIVGAIEDEVRAG